MVIFRRAVSNGYFVLFCHTDLARPIARALAHPPACAHLRTRLRTPPPAHAPARTCTRPPAIAMGQATRLLSTTLEGYKKNFPGELPI